MDLESLRSALADRYDLREEIGRGGTAVVYRARDLRHDRDVALKVFLPEVASVLGTERFLREIEIETSLQHPHLLPIFDSGSANGILYYVMPFMDGESVRDRLRRERQLSVDEALRVIRDVCSALAYAHGQGIVHRDIKPGNILLSSGQAVVADFGIARALESAGGERLTSSGIAIGTPQYMSPEQGGGDAEVDQRTDIYAVGCVLFEMLAGDPPFTGRTAQAVIARHMQERVPSIQVLRPDLPLSVVYTIERCLSKVPADRFASVGELLESLDTPIEEPGPDRRKPLALVLLAMVALLGGWWFLLRPEPAELDPNKIVVFPLVDLGLGQPGLGHDVAVSIEGALAYADPLKWIDGWERLDDRQRADPSLLRAREARAIAQERGSGFYITGAIQNIRDSAAAVVLRLNDVAGDSLVGQASADGLLGAVSVHQLTLDAVTDLLPRLVDPTRTIDLTPLRDRAPAAIALWIQGERQYRQSRFSEALDLYERSIAEDSALALAAIKGAQSASWIIRPQALDLASLALANEELLPARERALARGLHAYLTGSADSAVHHLEAALELDPEWGEAYTALGEVYFHLLPTRAPLDSLAEQAFLAAARVDSGFTPPLVHLAEMSLLAGDVSRADELLGRLFAFNPERHIVSHLPPMRDCVAGGPAAVDWSVPEALPPLQAMGLARMLGTAARQVACARAGYLALITSGVDAPAEKWGAFLGLQGLLVGTGRSDRALALLDSTVATGADYARPLYALFAHADPLFDAGAEAWAAEVGARASAGDPVEPYHLWLSASWLARQGRPDEVRPRLTALGALAASGNREAELYSEALEARLSLLAGDTTAAMARLSSLESFGDKDMLAWSYGLPLPLERLLLAELLLARGVPEQALRTASAFDHQGPFVFRPFLARSLELRLEAARASGRARQIDELARRLDRLTVGMPGLSQPETRR